MGQFVRLSVHLLFILWVSQMSVVIGTNLIAQSDHHQDPLVLYQDILPGAPVIIVSERYQCDWNVEMTIRTVVSSCRTSLEDEHFLLADIYIYNQRIESLELEASDLLIGDLPQYWGTPIVEDHEQYAYARWYISDYEVTAYVNTDRQHFSYWSSIRYLIINPIM